MSVRVYPPVVGASGGGGGGSGSNKGAPPGLEIKQLWTGNLTSITANQWSAVGTTAVPASAIWLIWNGGAFSSGTDDGPAGLSTWIDAAVWRALTADTVGSTPADGSGLLMVDWGATNIGDGTPDFARRDSVIGRTSANIPLILSTNSGEAFQGAKLSYVVATARVDAVAGDAAPAGAGYVYDISETNGGTPPTPTEDNSGSLYFNRDVGRLFIPTRIPAPDTPASATTTTIAAELTGFRGVLHQNPSVNINGDWYYNRNSHSWRYRASGSSLQNISFSELKMVAQQGGVDFFGEDDVWLNEVDRLSVAVGILENLGTYDSAKGYYFVINDTFYKIDTFTAAVNHQYDHDYIPISREGNNVAYWYVHGQTERWPSTFSYTENPSSSRLRMRFSGDAPNEAPRGWPWGVIWVDGSDVSANIDGSANPATSTNNVVFNLPAGVWSVKGTFMLGAEILAGAEFAMILYQIQSGDDKIRAIGSKGLIDLPANFGGANGTPVTVELEDFETDGSEQFYILAFNGSDDDWRGYIRVEDKT